MSSDNFDRALEALKQRPLEGPENGPRTWRRILDSRERRRRSKPVLLVLALTFVGAGAAAGVHEITRGHPTQRTAATLASLSNPPPLPAEGSVRASPLLAVNSPPPLAGEGRVGGLRDRQSPHATASPRPHVARAQLVVAADEPADSPASDPQDELFDQIRRAHAVAGTEEDLAGWERYLATYPHGRFAPEARYGRAVALAKLGRSAEASEVFQRFAQGTEGGYRAEESLRWMQAISGDL